MKFIKKHYKLLISILVCLLVFVIFKENNKNNQNYLSLGDGFALGKDSYGQVDYGYSDYLKDYLQENEYLNRYIKSFSEETMSITELKSKIIVNKKINIGNQELNLKQTLRESTILTLSIGLNDLIYQMSIADNLTDSKLDKIIANIEKDFNSLIIELKKYYQYDIYVIGYYNINPTNYFLTTGIKKLNNIYKNNKDIIYIDIYEDFQNNKNFRSRKQNIYPNRHGYQAISNKIIDKMAKRLEKQKNNWYTNSAFNYYDKRCHGGRRDRMKKDIHPTMVDCKVTCACGETFTVKSTKPEISVEVCSKCHPFYTGKQSRASRAGRVDKFNRKYGLNQNETAE